jgi:hypothetical protein
MNDELDQIEQILALAAADDQLSPAEKIDLLSTTCDRPLAACRETREQAERRQAVLLSQIRRKQERIALMRMEVAEAVALRQAAIDLTNQLTLLREPDESTLWRLGGKPLERDYQALRAALTSDAGADLLNELHATRALADAVEQYHAASRAIEIDPGQREALAAAAYQLGQALGAYRAAQKEAP